MANCTQWISKDEMRLCFDRVLYNSEAIFKACFHFLDKCYFYIDQDDKYYIVYITCKTSELEDSFLCEFQNELLAQMVRLQVYGRTHVIRELLMTRALASTIVVCGDESPSSDEMEEENDLSAILKDWFLQYEYEQ